MIFSVLLGTPSNAPIIFQSVAYLRVKDCNSFSVGVSVFTGDLEH